MLATWTIRLGSTIQNSKAAKRAEVKLASLSACHAGRLAGNRTPVGSAEIIYAFF
jgi:hypothetical protein